MIPKAANEVIQMLKDAGFKAFLVGGCVRDMLRGVEPHDFDIATSATPEQVTAIFARVVPTGIAHGTVTVIMKNNNVAPGVDGRLSSSPTFPQFEVTTFRSEGAYTDGRHPDSVKFETDITADLSRRDFTINAMAYDPITGILVDPFGGAADLERGTIRAVGDANERFNEDGLRIMRAVRFATTFNFGIEESTFEAITTHIPVFQKVAIERTQEEFFKILLSRMAPRGLNMLVSTGLLQAFLPSIGSDSKYPLIKAFAKMGELPADLEVKLAALVKSSNQTIEALSPLKLPTRTVQRISTLLEFPIPRAVTTDKGLRAWLRAIGPSPESIEQAVALGRASGWVIEPELMERIGKLAKDPLFHHQLALNGDEIMAAMGVTRPGSAVGHAIRFLMNLVMEDPSQNTPELLKKALVGLDVKAAVL